MNRHVVAIDGHDGEPLYVCQSLDCQQPYDRADSDAVCDDVYCCSACEDAAEGFSS